MTSTVETTDSESRETLGYYKCSKLEALKSIDRAPTETELQKLKIAYDQVCSTWRTLLDVRFKLLGLIPFVTVGVLIVVIPESGAQATLKGLDAAVVGIVGLLAVAGLLIYEIRNSELYNDLISRGRRLEAEIGLQNGIFLGRPSPKRKLLSHSPAISLVYFAAILGWLFIVVQAA